MIEILAAGLQGIGVPFFIGSAVFGAAIGIAMSRFNLFYLLTHAVSNKKVQIFQYIFLHLYIRQIDKASKRHGGEIVAKVLESHGIQHLFTLSGGHISPILAAAEKIGIKVVDTRHEV